MKSIRLLYLIFFLSGATGLVYEVIWVRLTGLVFGNTSHAIAVVLGAFMAGLAFGSWRLGRRVDRVASPLRMYGLLEIGIGVSAALVPFAFRALNGLYWTLAPSLDGIPAADGFIRFLTSFLILLVPTFLMGGTLPVLARFFAHAVDEVERKVAILYALNTFGAAAGTLTAALLLIPQLGNTVTTLIIATMNLVIGTVAIVLDSRLPVAVNGGEPSSNDAIPAGVSSPAEVSDAETAIAHSRRDRLVLLTLAASGLVSMIYEVAWTRALSAMIGSSTYAFSIMLITFLVGIAIGSSIVSRRRPPSNLGTLGVLQLGVAAGGVIFLVGYVVLPYVLMAVIRALYYSFAAVLTTQFISSAALMIFATLCMGATLPIASQMYSRRLKVLGRSIGNVYSVNTLGAIAGSLIAGFVLLPLVGTERTILVGLFINAAIALLLLTEASARKGLRLARVAAVLLLAIATLGMYGGIFWPPQIMDLGVLIYAQQFEARPELTIAEHYEDTDVAYFKEGSNATISVRKGDDYIGLRTNGKVDASNGSDMITQLLVGYLPVLYHPAPRTVMVIGYGSGVTVGATTAFKELERIDCIEIEPAVFGAANLFSDINRKSYDNPKVRMTFADARRYINITREKYDVIISEPSNPWVAGVASLFTSDFYDRVEQVLKPDGVFAQWVQLYELDPEDLRMILQEVQRKFPEVSAWVVGGDLILIATRQPQHLQIERIVQLAKSDPDVMADLRNYMRITEPEGILAYYVMSTDAVRKFAQTTRRNSDDHPVLEFHAPQQLFNDTRDLNVDLLYDAKDGLLPVGVNMPDPEAVFSAMVDPLLRLNRPNLANQAMGMLAQTPRKDDASLQLAVAQINLYDGALAQAEESMRKASEKLKQGSPLLGKAEELWGALSEQQGDKKEAIRHYRIAAMTEPQRPLSFRKLAELYGAEKNWSEAALWMAEYITTKPKSIGSSHAILGDYYLDAGQPDKAQEAFQTALTLDQYSYWAHYRLASVFEGRNDSANAIKEYEILVKYALDRDEDIYIKLAKLYKSAGRTEDLKSLLNKGKRIFPTNTEIYRLYRDAVGTG